jgi:hydroxyacylglutathione hydrolase
MTRSIPVTENAVWWPSTLFQTTTLELRRNGERLLVDPGISLWETEEVVAGGPGPVTEVLLTHADWDHVMGVGVLPEARVTASRGALERIESGQARASIVKEAAEFYIDHAGLDHLRVDQVVDAPAEVMLGQWHALCRPGKGHTDDGIVTSFPEERLLVVGDYLSAIEIPWAYSSVLDYRDTLRMLIGVIERERPRFVVGGHGRPNRSEQALKIADEDLDYLDALVSFAEAGCPPEHAGRIAMPVRGEGTYGEQAHAANVKLACKTVGASVPA